MATTLSALDLPFDEAIAFLRQKANVTSRDYTDVWGKANVKSYTVAGASTEALVNDFRAETAKALETGTSIQEFRKTFDKIVTKHGWDHTGTPGFRSRIIFETNLGMAYSAGRYAQQTETETLAAFPFWQYVHSGALHPRKQHQAWNGLTLRADDPFWKTHYPPNGWRCGCRTRPVSARGMARMGKSGPDTAPPIKLIEHTIRKTGEVIRVPEGIDPGFDYNVGQEWTGQAPQIPANATLTAKTGAPPPASPPPPPAAPAAPPPPPASDPGPVLVMPPVPPAPGVPIPPPPRGVVPRSPAPARPAPPAGQPIRPKQKELDLGPVPALPVRPRAANVRITPRIDPERPAWPWKPQPRRKPIQMEISNAALDQAEKLGIFRNHREARRLANELMAGIPDSLSVKASWEAGDKAVRLVVDHAEVRLERTFWRDADGLVVDHDLFWMLQKHQGKGGAKRMLRTSFAAYDRIGVAKVQVHANIDVGGYTWARSGFRVEDAEDMRDLLRDAASTYSPTMRLELLRVVESSSDTELMYNVATVTDAGGPFGKQVLLGSDWFGVADLVDPVHRDLLARALR
ncbi:putative head morphogenesis protein SPP1 gp7 [Xanthobacter versatilis]|uniref:Putative head morphogenesis protein SPP1 gp7 n=1 Tax=Xanthobacter autotrophicus (strain ATCC BAA-1158 / Py2) TaxID=78245 RepID=A7INX6_XANP2|nr:putative head morphogenesis protein SPP1 gp7 [Xanthobacter autotrophicus Py2]